MDRDPSYYQEVFGMEGLSDSQRFRNIPTPIETAKPDDKGQKVIEIEDEKKEQRREEGGGDHKASSQSKAETEENPAANQQVGQAGAKDQGIDPGGQETYISKGSTRITDADEIIAIARICTKHNATDVKADELTRELQEQGIDCYETTIDGKPAVKFANGDVFVDSSGNNALGLEDGDFTKALSRIEQKFGINLDDLEGQVQAQLIKRDMEDKKGTINGYGPMLDGLLNRGLDGPGMEMDGSGMNGEGDEGRDDAFGAIDPFEDLDGRLRDRGYQGPQARSLYEGGSLEPILQRFGIDMPSQEDLQQQHAMANGPASPQAADLSNQMHRANKFAQSVFKSAMLISQIQQ
jgi:hypothetical protein